MAGAVMVQAAGPSGLAFVSPIRILRPAPPSLANSTRRSIQIFVLCATTRWRGDEQHMEETMNRRAFLAGTAATATAVTVQAATAATEGPFGATGVPVTATEPLPLGPLSGSRYPDPHIEVLDKRFKGSPGTGAVERLATGFRWAEGPVYFPAGRYLLFSDIPNNRIMRLSEDDNHLSVFRYPSFNSNGNTIDREGRLVTCEHGGRRVTRTELDGSVTIIADKYNGKRLNSPNDVAVASDGSIWFTDPVYGITGNYEGIGSRPSRKNTTCTVSIRNPVI
jgi:gluconolactonase